MYTTICADPPAKRPARRRGLSSRALNRVLEYVEKNLGERLTLAILADVACVSRFHFARRFRLNTGTSPMAYVRARRAERATELLDDSCPLLAQVAVNLGFFDQSHFTRSFRKTIGVTPGQYARAAHKLPLSRVNATLEVHPRSSH